MCHFRQLVSIFNNLYSSAVARVLFHNVFSFVKEIESPLVISTTEFYAHGYRANKINVYTLYEKKISYFCLCHSKSKDADIPIAEMMSPQKYTKSRKSQYKHVTCCCQSSTTISQKAFCHKLLGEEWHNVIGWKLINPLIVICFK